MNTFRTALKALSHPLSLFSIIILLVNDHILKVVVPSPLTGKLSDFAGLFFFPFLLAGLLEWVGERLGFTPRRMAGLAFWITVVWFAGIKTTPWLNALTADFAELLLGHPTFIVLDPTDLISLIVIPFSWALWRRMEQEKNVISWKTIQVFAFGLALLSAVASISCPPELTVQRVVAFENTFYVHLEHFDPAFFSSSDYGKSWQRIDEVPPFVTESIQQTKPFPIQECVPGKSQLCYRITGDTKIEFSNNGGETWKTVWRAPTWRTDYYNRLLNFPLSCELHLPDFIPVDLTILSLKNGEYFLVAALGNQGLVTYQPSMGWSQLAVMEADPHPSSVQWDELITLPVVIPVETILWIVIGFLTPHSLLSKWKSFGQSDLQKTKKNKLAFSFLIWPFILLLIWHLVSDFAELELEVYPPYLIFILLVVFLGGDEMGFYSLVGILGALGLFYANYRSITTRIEREFTGNFATQFRTICLRSSLLLFLAGWLPFAFWALGWIPLFWLAFLLSFGLAIVVYLKALQAVEKFSPN